MFFTFLSKIRSVLWNICIVFLFFLSSERRVEVAILLAKVVVEGLKSTSCDLALPDSAVCSWLFFFLRHFGHLSHNSIKTRRNSIHKPTFSNVMSELILFFRPLKKNSVYDRKMAKKIQARTSVTLRLQFIVAFGGAQHVDCVCRRGSDVAIFCEVLELTGACYRLQYCINPYSVAWSSMGAACTLAPCQLLHWTQPLLLLILGFCRCFLCAIQGMQKQQLQSQHPSINFSVNVDVASLAVATLFA